MGLVSPLNTHRVQASIGASIEEDSADKTDRFESDEKVAGVQGVQLTHKARLLLEIISNSNSQMREKLQKISVLDSFQQMDPDQK